jgi:hypothetical protein
MKKKKRAKPRPSTLGLPKGWTLPALADRRTKPRPDRESVREHQRAVKKRRK